MLYTLVTLVACLGAATAREASKTMPTISNSLVNLGKMGISFYFNSKVPEQQSALDESNFFSKPKPEPCPCTAMRNFKNFPNPTDILHKLMKNEPPKSMTCCDSHEQFQEDTIFFEIGPKLAHTDLSTSANTNPINKALPLLPMIFNNLIPSNQMSLPSVPVKPKAIEIFLFPKKKDILGQGQNADSLLKKKSDIVKKSDIQIVGDKELRNDFKTFKFRPIPPMSSIKKDLADVDKTESAVTTKETGNTEVPSTTLFTNGNNKI